MKKTQTGEHLVCLNCGLLIAEEKLIEETRIVPQYQMGISVNEKPYFNQVAANTKYQEPDIRPSAFSLDNLTNKQILDQYTLKGLADTKNAGMKISRKGRRIKITEETLQEISKLMSRFGTDVKVELT